MKYSAFEKEIKRKLADREMDIDTEALLGRLNLLPEKKRRARIFYLPLLGLTVLASFLLWQTTTGHTSAETVITASEAIPLSVPIAEEALPAVLTAAHEVQEHNEKEEKTGTTSTKSFEDSPFKNSKTTSERNATGREAVSRNASHVSPPTHPELPASSERSTDDVRPSTTVLPVTDGIQANDADGQSAESDRNDSRTETAAVSDRWTALNALPGLDLGDLTAQPVLPAMKKVECPDFRNNKSWFDLEILAEIGAFLPIKSFDPAAGGDEADALRLQNEVSKEGYHAGIYAKLNARSLPVYIQAGLSQDFLTERMSLDYSYTRRDTTQGIISITESEDGDTITVIIGDIIKETEVSGKKIKHYRLQTIDIPLTVGYNFDYDRFVFFIEGGPVFNLSMRSTGSILTSATEFEDVGIGQPFKSRIGISYQAAAGLAYRLSDRIKLYANTKFRYLPTAINTSANGLDQHYRFLGANVGLGYQF